MRAMNIGRLAEDNIQRFGEYDLKTAGATSEEDLINFCKENLPAYKRPKWIHCPRALLAKF
jgi:acyl-CoA synthetase (AMP-forming)/AMP-acid ligase II